MHKLLEQLRSKLNELDGAIDAFDATLKDADGKYRDLTEGEQEKLSTFAADRDKLEKQIADTEALIKSKAATAKPASAEPSDTPRITSEEKLDKGAKVGLVVAAMVRAHVEDNARGERAMLKAMSDMGYPVFAREFDAMRKKAMSSTSASAGGVLVPETMSSEIIDLLYPATTFLQGGPVRIPMPAGNYKQPAGASGATASYKGEGGLAGVSQPTMREISMSAKMLSAIVPVTNQLIRWSLPSVQQFVNNDLSMALGVRMDLAAYRGDGTADTPLGITNIPGVYSTGATNSTTPTYTNIDSDAAKLELVMENVNLPMVNVAWVMAPRVAKYIENLRDGNGNKVYPEMSGETPRFRRRKVLITSQIPTNLGGGTNESAIYLIAFGHVLFGETMAMQFSISDQATVKNGSETLYLWQQGMTAVKAEMEHDFDIRYQEAVGVLSAVKWGA